jgi:biopolymer transport protein ExbB
MTMRNALTALALAGTIALLPTTAHAWWNADWTERAKITLNTSAQGLETKETASAVAVAVRLHSGNFDFTAAKEDGSDLRVVAGDDKTPLKFSIERFDSINELAVLWVQVPSVMPGSDKNVFYVYGGNAKATAEADANGTAGFDAATVIALHFSDKPAGADQLGAVKPRGPLATEPNGLLAASAKLSGEAVVYALSDKPVVDAGNQLTVSLWVKLDDVQRATLLNWGGLTLSLNGGKVVVRTDKAEMSGGDVPAARWTQVALRLGLGKATLFVDGAQVAQGDLATPQLGSSLALGDGARGLMDEVQVAATLRSADWIAVAAGTQGAQSKLVASTREAQGSAEAEGGEHGYMGILIKNLTVDAWVVIIILAVMFAIAAWVMVSKSLLMSRVAKANRSFVLRFREASDELLKLEAHAPHPNSPIYRLYQAGVRELAKRQVGEAGAKPLSGASLDAVKASVDADYVRENAQLNSGMVLLTIAISGGPFLGLLGTVVGVMITFAAIAAAGDVNVNAIAPGIAAALLATVAGLGVAIPALFGYNWLASQIKNATSDMQIFIDEFITRVAELYGAP